MYLGRPVNTADTRGLTLRNQCVAMSAYLLVTLRY